MKIVLIEAIAVFSGICLAIIATFCFNIAIVLEKKGLKQSLPENNFKLGVNGTYQFFKKIFKNRLWTTGFILSIIGWLPYMFAQAIVGVLIVTPIMSLGLIVSVFFANHMLREKISFFEYIAIGMLIIAPFLIAFSGISNIRINLFTFVPSFIVFLTIIIIVELTCYLIVKVRKHTKYESILLIVMGSLFFSLGAIFTNIFVQAIMDASINFLTFFILAEILFGIFWFEYFHTWVFIGIWGIGIANFVGLIFQQNALHKSRAFFLWSIQNGISMIIPVLAGLLIFNQSVVSNYLFFIAFSLIFIATLILSKFQGDIESIRKLQNNSEIIAGKKE